MTKSETAGGGQEPSGPRRLYKVREGRMIDGVCAGLAVYSGIDVTLVRLVTVLLALMGGIGLVVYLAAMLIVPKRPPEAVEQGKAGEAGEGGEIPDPEGHRRNIFFLGIALVLVGLFLMGVRFEFFKLFSWHWWDGVMKAVWPLSVLVSGIILFLFPWLNRSLGRATAAETVWCRSTTDRKVLGVCGGLAEHLKADPTLIRILWIAVILFTSGFGLLVYFFAALILPEKLAT